MLIAETWSYDNAFLEFSEPQSLSCHTPWTFCQGCCMSQGLGKTVELLACVLANRFKGPRLPVELVHSHCSFFPVSQETHLNVHPCLEALASPIALGQSTRFRKSSSS